MKTKPTKNYQLGAAHERQAVIGRLRRRINQFANGTTVRSELAEELAWILDRVKRYTAKPGGLQGRKRKAAK